MRKQPKAPKKDKGPICPKCGAHEGWNGPRYRPGSIFEKAEPDGSTGFRVTVTPVDEALIYSCLECGYQRIELPLDRK